MKVTKSRIVLAACILISIIFFFSLWGEIKTDAHELSEVNALLTALWTVSWCYYLFTTLTATLKTRWDRDPEENTK